MRKIFLCTFLALTFVATITAAEIDRMEYFVDADPGPGNGTPLSITPGGDILATEVIDLTALDDGMHWLRVRSRDTEGTWSQICSRAFIKISEPLTPSLSSINYYFDSDTGNTVSIPAQPYGGDETESVMDLTIDCDALGLDPGLRLLHAYTLDANGKASLHQTRIYNYVPDGAPDICRICWYFSGGDADPGLEYYIPFDPPLDDITHSFAASLLHLTHGTDYLLHVYSRDTKGNISQHQVLPFTANFSPLNLTLNLMGNMAVLNWDQIAGATYYVVKVKDDPMAEGTPFTVTGTTFLTSATEAKKFFSVIAGMD